LPLPPEPPDPTSKRPRPVTPPPLQPLPTASTPPHLSQPSTLKSLGKYVRAHTTLLRQLGWHRFIKHLQHPTDISPYLDRLPHPAASYLHRLAVNRVPAPSQEKPCPIARLRNTLKKGAHVSAKHPFKDFLFEDLLDMVQKGYWTVLPFSAVKSYQHLKLSPSGVVPQRTRRPRPIMDYSFTGVNMQSLPLSPTMAMQFGHALPRLLQHIAYADPAYGPPLLLKLDLADGYYRVQLTPEAALELAVVLPGPTIGTSYIGIPLCLPMGWAHSPPYFCAFTETAVDLTNVALQQADHPWSQLEHPLEAASQSMQLPLDAAYSKTIVHPPSIPPQRPLSLAEVYINDFIGVAQRPVHPRVLRFLLHAISSIFRQHPHRDDNPNRKQTISASKLLKGDGCWSTQKNILGWDIDTARGLLQLPSHKATRLSELVLSFAKLHRTSRTKWYSLLGELRHMATAIQGASHLFSILQSPLVQQPTAKRLKLPDIVHHALDDWATLANTLAAVPVPIATLVPRAPHFVGAVDTSQQGIGGFWLPTRHAPQLLPMAFRCPFPDHIASRLISTDNPSGDLTNSDFELAALVLGCTTLASTYEGHYPALWCGSDNTPAVSWCWRGSTSTTKANAHLLRWLAQLTQHHTFSLKPISVSGKSNHLADFCSRSFHLDDQEFIQQLQSTYPIEPSWTIVQPSNANVSGMISALSCRMSPWVQPPTKPYQLPPHGASGNTSVHLSTPIQPSPNQTTQSLYFNSSPIVTVGENYLPARLKSAVKQWQMPFAPLGRRSPTWDTLIPDFCLRVN
jgi:hypothetical protein